MEMSESDYRDHCDNYDGFCVNCDDVTNSGGTEPDARNYECSVCGLNKVMGIEEALMEGKITISDD